MTFLLAMMKPAEDREGGREGFFLVRFEGVIHGGGGGLAAGGRRLLNSEAQSGSRAGCWCSSLSAYLA